MAMVDGAVVVSLQTHHHKHSLSNNLPHFRICVVPYSAMGPDGVAQGYASYGTDTGKFSERRRKALLTFLLSGHQSSSRNGSWGLGNDDAIIDHAYRALHLTTVASKALTIEYYGQNHTKSYYSGCSTGGRQGLRAITMFPQDYDGIV